MMTYDLPEDPPDGDLAAAFASTAADEATHWLLYERVQRRLAETDLARDVAADDARERQLDAEVARAEELAAQVRVMEAMMTIMNTKSRRGSTAVGARDERSTGPEAKTAGEHKEKAAISAPSADDAPEPEAEAESVSLSSSSAPLLAPAKTPIVIDEEMIFKTIDRDPRRRARVDRKITRALAPRREAQQERRRRLEARGFEIQQRVMALERRLTELRRGTAATELASPAGSGLS